MKKIYLLLAAAIVGVLLFAGINRKPTLPYGFITGTPEIKSIASLTFGPNGILFIGDSQSATVFAMDTKDTKKAIAKPYELQNIDTKIAESLGTTKENIVITDIAVNPVSKKLYIAVTASGAPLLLTLDNSNTIKAVSLKDINYSSVELNDAPATATDPTNRRAMQARISSISDMAYADGKLMLSGLCNKEFSSSFRAIAFPFTGKQEDESTLEMYHTSHGRYETTSPIRTFSATTIDGKNYIIASYTCTPLVLFPMDELKPGAHVKGRTIAEMGNQNTPSDMIWLKENNRNYLVMANSARPVVKVSYDDIQKFQGSLTQQMPTFGGTAFTKLPYEKVLQMDKLDDDKAVLIQKKADGEVDLWTSDGKNL